jgi:hypothetical protein
MEWEELLNDDPLPWLLEDDPQNPGVRYFVLRDLLDLPPDDPRLRILPQVYGNRLVRHLPCPTGR